MQQVALPIGTAVHVARGGPVVRILNDPSIDYYLAHDAAQSGALTPDPGVIGAYVLVGFDNDPSASNHDAILPPFSEALIAVPDSVAELHLLWSTDPGATITIRTANAYSSLPVGVEWIGVPVPTGIRPLYGIGPFFMNTGNLQGRLVVPMDRWGFTWPPRPPEYIYDQGNGNVGAHVRPRLAPYVSTANVVNAAANTLFNLVGQYGFPNADPPPSSLITFKFNVIKRIIVSLAAGGLFVMGADDLTVGSPGVHETGRVVLPANTPFVFEYDEGIEAFALDYAHASGGVTNLRAYVGTAGLVHLTIIGA